MRLKHELPAGCVKELSESVKTSNTKKLIYCPDCHAGLRKERIHPLIPVHVDACAKCDYIWFDHGEQTLLLRLYRDLLNTGDPRLAAKRDKLAQLEQFHSRPLPGSREFDVEVAAVLAAITAATDVVRTSRTPQQIAARLAVMAMIGLATWVYRHYKRK
jgi:Zn-finger nucleic acid-binding protein